MCNKNTTQIVINLLDDFLRIPFACICLFLCFQELLLNSRHIKPQSFYKNFQYVFGARFMGNGLVSEINHEKWFHRRAIMNPAFRRK